MHAFRIPIKPIQITPNIYKNRQIGIQIIFIYIIQVNKVNKPKKSSSKIIF